MKEASGVDLTALKKRKKAVIIDALKEKYVLPILLSYFHMARSSYYYQKVAMNKLGKYLLFHVQSYIHLPRNQKSI